MRLELEMSWTDIVKDNPWLVPVFGAVAIGVAFVTAGPIWGFFNLYLASSSDENDEGGSSGAGATSRRSATLPR